MSNESLSYLKLFFVDLDLLERKFTNEEIGRIIVAVKNYAEDGTKCELPEKLS